MTNSETTAGPFPEGYLTAEANRLIDHLQEGGLALIPLDVAYAIVGMTTPAIRKLFQAKQRSYEKPSGMLGDATLSRQLHILDSDRHAMVDTIIEKENLPFSVVAPFRADHPFLQTIEPFVMQTSSKADTLDILINAGLFHNTIAAESQRRGQPVFGSSANLSLTGSRFRLQDIDTSVRDAATMEIDHGQSKYANEHGRSSTIIDFRDFTVIRVGVCFMALQRCFQERFDVQLRITGATNR